MFELAMVNESSVFESLRFYCIFSRWLVWFYNNYRCSEETISQDTAYVIFITKTRLFKYTEVFTTKKGNFSDKKF